MANISSHMTYTVIFFNCVYSDAYLFLVLRVYMASGDENNNII